MFSVVETHDENDPFNQLLHSALGEDAEKGYLVTSEVETIFNTTKNRFNDHSVKEYFKFFNNIL